MTKIAAEKAAAGPRAATKYNPPETRVLASGEGWAVKESVCTAGPKDKPFEEQHEQISIGVVLSGSFQYRSATGVELMTPGSLLLGNAGESFCCAHEHGTGDRCVSFSYGQGFEQHVGMPAKGKLFNTPRIPAIRGLSSLLIDVAQLPAMASQERSTEIAIRILGAAVRLQAGSALCENRTDPSSLARVTRVIRAIESDPNTPNELSHLARIARLSPYHFLRTFRALTGTTPHQYVLRTHLKRAAFMLRQDAASILEIALECGFDGASTFSRAFRSEFGMSARTYRASRASWISNPAL